MRPIYKSEIKKLGYCAICNKRIALVSNGIWHHLEDVYGPTSLYMATEPIPHNAKPIPPGCVHITEENPCKKSQELNQNLHPRLVKKLKNHYEKRSREIREKIRKLRLRTHVVVITDEEPC